MEGSGAAKPKGKTVEEEIKLWVTSWNGKLKTFNCVYSEVDSSNQQPLSSILLYDVKKQKTKNR